jgi:hypothetical protein
MSRLAPQEMKQLHRALLSGFDHDTLRMLVQLELAESLDAIVPSGSLSSVAFDLIMWAERQGRTEELIKAVMAVQPKNQEIAALGNLLPGPVGENTAAADPAIAEADWLRRLHSLLLDHFPQESDLAILLDDSLGQALNRVAGGATQTVICFKLVQWLWVDRVGRLRPFLDAAVRERPNLEDLKLLQRQIFPD